MCLVMTPSARSWWADDDVKALAALTGHPVRHTYKHPDHADALPAADALLVAPATFNTINKWALDISDTLVLGLITEAIGLQLPVVALSYLNAAQAAHPALDRSVKLLREHGVDVLLGEGGFVPHVPKHGDVDAYPWAMAIAALSR